MANGDTTSPSIAGRCDRCFAEKEVSSLFQGAPITCCRACRYKISEILDFLSYHGIRVDVSAGGGFSAQRDGDGAADKTGGSGEDSPTDLPSGPAKGKKKPGKG